MLVHVQAGHGLVVITHRRLTSGFARGSFRGVGVLAIGKTGGLGSGGTLFEGGLRQSGVQGLHGVKKTGLLTGRGR